MSSNEPQLQSTFDTSYDTRRYVPPQPRSQDFFLFDPQTGTFKSYPTEKSLKAGITKEENIAPFGWHIGPYFFDCWLNCSQSSTVTITSHPVALGANISDHAYSEPLEFSFEIGVSNTIANNFFDGADQRSINAYNLLTQLQAKREFVEVGTKYGTYQNILIKNITVNDTFDSQDKMVALVTLQEVITANTQTYQVSANRQATDKTNRGNVPTTPPFGTIEYRKYIIDKTKEDLGRFAA